MKKNDRFVFDTNVVISAFLFPDSVPGCAFDRAIWLGKFVISKETMSEINEVFSRKKFEKYLPLPVRKYLLSKYEKSSQMFLINENVSISRDPDDDKFLLLAKAAKANAIISGDPDLLVLKLFENIPIITPAEFLKIF